MAAEDFFHRIGNFADGSFRPRGIDGEGQQIALTGFGWLVGFMGAKAYLVAALFALLGAGCIWLSIRMKQPQSG